MAAMQQLDIQTFLKAMKIYNYYAAGFIYREVQYINIEKEKVSPQIKTGKTFDVQQERYQSEFSWDISGQLILSYAWKLYNFRFSVQDIVINFLKKFYLTKKWLE